MTPEQASSGRLRRISAGLAANLASVGARLALQFVTLPILFAVWDSERVGTWMLLFALPAYLALASTGFSAAGGNLALVEAREGRMDAAKRDFRIAWALATGATIILSGLLLLVAWAAGDGLENYLPGLDGALLPVLAWLSLYALASGQMMMLDIPFRLTGRYATLMLVNALASIAEIAALLIAMQHSETLANLAMTLSVTRCLMALFGYLVARRIAPELMTRKGLSDGTGERPRGRLRAFWKPSASFMLIPVIFGLNIQGYTLVIGALLGPVVLAAFVATRTLARAIDVFTSMSFASQFYEFGYIDAEQKGLQRRILATVTAVTLLVGFGFSAALLVFGPWLQSWLTGGKTEFAPLLAAILLVSGIIRSLASNYFALLASRNIVARVTATYCIWSAASLLGAVALALAGAPVTLVAAMLWVAESSQFILAQRQVLAKLDWRFSELLAAVFSRERLEDLGKLWQQAARPRLG